jgi:hypothetical protein
MHPQTNVRNTPAAGGARSGQVTCVTMAAGSKSPIDHLILAPALRVCLAALLVGSIAFGLFAISNDPA